MRQLPPSNLGHPPLLGSGLFLWAYEFKFYAATLVRAHDVQAVLHVLLLTNLSSLAPPYLRFSSAVYTAAAWWWKAHCVKDPCVRVRTKSSTTLSHKNGEREETSRGRSIKGSAGGGERTISCAFSWRPPAFLQPPPPQNLRAAQLFLSTLNTSTANRTTLQSHNKSCYAH